MGIILSSCGECLLHHITRRQETVVMMLVVGFLGITTTLTPLNDLAQNAHSLTVQRGQNAHYVPSLYRVLTSSIMRSDCAVPTVQI